MKRSEKLHNELTHLFWANVVLMIVLIGILSGCGKEDRLLEQYSLDYQGYKYDCMRDFQTKAGPLYCWARYSLKDKKSIREECRDTLPPEWDVKQSEGRCEYAEDYY
jgi:hypothetical protein